MMGQHLAYVKYQSSRWTENHEGHAVYVIKDGDIFKFFDRHERHIGSIKYNQKTPGK